MVAISQERYIVTTLRLSPSKHRQLRLAVARRETSIQKALESAIDLWLAAPEKNTVSEESGMALEGMLAGVDALGALKKEHREEVARDARKLRG
jgi:hypothetical protein